MRVTLERSGGFTGIPMTVTVDGADLAPEDAAMLQQLVNQAHFFDLPTTLPTQPQPDRFQYQITIDTGDRVHEVTGGESALPADLRPLIDWLWKFR